MAGKRNTKLIKSVFIYGVGNIGSKFIRFLLIPLYTFFLTKDELGLYDLILTTILLIEPILTVKITESTFRWLIDKKSDEKITISTTFFFVLVLSLLGSGLILAYDYFFTAIPYVKIIVALLFFRMISNFFSESARGLEKDWIYALYGLSLTILSFAFALVALIYSDDKLLGLLVSSVIALIISNIFMYVILIRHYLVFTFSTKELKQYILYSSPLVPSSINWWGIKLLNRYIISLKIGLSWNGVFAVVYTFPQICTMLGQIFYLAWQKSSIQEYSSDDRDEYYSNLFSKYVNIQFSLIFLMLAITRLSYLVLFEESYHFSYAYSYPLLLGSVFNSFGAFYAVSYLGAKRTVGAFMTSFIGFVVNAAVLVAYTEQYGLWAAGVANLLGFIFLWVTRIYDSKKYSNIQVPWIKVILYTFLFSLISIIIILIDEYLKVILFIEFISLLISIYLSKEIINNLYQKYIIRYVKK